jgi:hypothetical protein
MANRRRARSETDARSIAAKLDDADGEAADQKTTHTTLPRWPTNTNGSEVSRSSSRSGGAKAPTLGGSVRGVPLVLSQIAPKSAIAVTTNMIAVTGSGRRRRGGSLGSSIDLPCISGCLPWERV